MGRDKVKIALIEDVNEVYDAKTKKAIPFYTFDRDDYDGKVIATSAAKATLAELIELCDHDAENCNRHDFVGVHERLAEILCARVGRRVATRIMRQIAERRGLHGMSQED